jgi:hypothetical protein
MGPYGQFKFVQPPLSPQAAQLLREALTLPERDRVALAADVITSVRSLAREERARGSLRSRSHANATALLRERGDHVSRGHIEGEENTW